MINSSLFLQRSHQITWNSAADCSEIHAKSTYVKSWLPRTISCDGRNPCNNLNLVFFRVLRSHPVLYLLGKSVTFGSVSHSFTWDFAQILLAN